MRTTLTLDDDVAAKLKTEARRTGMSFKETVNRALRLALSIRKKGPAKKPFKVEARDLGDLRPGLTLDNISELIEHVEGPLHK
jgi:hypothetical protein